jgi:hypothetical protein
MLVILVTWESQIRNIMAPGKLRKSLQKFQDSTSMKKKLGLVAHICHPSYGRKLKTEG